MVLHHVRFCGSPPAVRSHSHPAGGITKLSRISKEVVGEAFGMSHSEFNAQDDVLETKQHVEGSTANEQNTPVSNDTTEDSQLESVERERDMLRDRLARTQAEFENSRKRMEREQQEYREYALADAIRSLFPSLDSLDWALQSPTETLPDFKNGVELIRKQFQSALENLGVTPIAAHGQPFDPRYHEAVDTVEAGASAPNTVVEELRRGYKLGDRLLRPAIVLVAKEPTQNK
jgi:molecular chaperone GrpE